MTDRPLKLTDVVLTHRGREVRLFCAHDAFELSEFQAGTQVVQDQAFA